MMPSTTRRSSRKGRPRRPSEDGNNGWMRAHCPSVKTEVRDTHQASRLNQPRFRRHALVALEFVLHALAHLFGVCLDLVGLAFCLQAVVVGRVACSFLGLAAKVLCRVTDLVSEAHGSGLLSFPSINRAPSR